MSWEYSENILVQENAGKVLQDRLHWDEVIFAYDKEKLGPGGVVRKADAEEAPARGEELRGVELRCGDEAELGRRARKGRGEFLGGRFERAIRIGVGDEDRPVQRAHGSKY